MIIVFVLPEKNDDNIRSLNQMQSEYKVVNIEDLSYAGCKRIGIRIVVPDNLPPTDVNDIFDQLIDRYKKNHEDITVWAWEYSEEPMIGNKSYTKGIREYSVCN